MTALLLAEEIPASVVPDVPLPDVFRARMNDCDEPVHGSLREIMPRMSRSGRPDPVELRLGDYLLDESGVWLRVRFVEHGATGSRVHAFAGVSLFVAAGRQVWVWPAPDVLVWAVLGESVDGAR